MKCRYTRHVLLRMGERSINKQMVEKAVNFSDKVERVDKRSDKYTLDKLIVNIIKTSICVKVYWIF